jgi:cobalt/nickel transport protein
VKKFAAIGLVPGGVLAAMLCFSAGPALAHFGMVIPDQHIMDQEKKDSILTLSFSHPFENIGMDLTQPGKFTVTVNGKTTDLLSTLKPASVMGHKGWESSFSFTRPGVYQFVMEPTPYWEPAEDLSIIHYTKTIIPAFGDDEGWDEPVGLPTEIIPLLRPFGNYAGNSFSGQVLVKGKPVAGAEVEVEFYNKDNTLQPRSDYHVTQVIKADQNGIFTFTCPLAGWWGFAALSQADYTLKDPQGNEKGVELGAVLWTYLDKLPEAQQ